MKWRLIFATVLLAVGATDALAAASGIVRPSIDLTEVRVVVHWMDTDREVLEVCAEYLGKCEANASGRRSAEGFSVLRRDLETGEYTCDIYAVRPSRVNDKRTNILGHELLHCLAGDYHE